MIGVDDLRKRFEYHPPRPGSDDAERHTQVRQACMNAADIIMSVTDPGREQSLAITHLEQAMFWANADIARNKDSDA